MDQRVDLEELPGRNSYRDEEFSDDLRERKRSERRARRYSRERSTERKENRKRRHEKRSQRKYSSDSSKSPSPSRSKSHRRSRNQRRRSYSYHSNDSSDESNRDRPRRSRRTDYARSPSPNSTIMVRGLALHLGEDEIRQDVLKCGIMVKDVRLIRHRDTGCSRGFAFVEFSTVQDASRWMEMKKGVLSFDGLPQASLIYSVPKMLTVDHESKSGISDWFCGKCQAHNFKRRALCYKCQSLKPVDIDDDGADNVSVHPTSTIILGNLDALTTEETILHAFEQRSVLASVPIRSVRVCRDSLTNLSKGICYVEANTITDATRLYSALHDDSFEVDSRRVTIAYKKPASQHSAVSSIAATALAAARWSVQGDSDRSTSATYSEQGKSALQEEVEKLAEYSASLYAKSPEEHASYLIYYREYYQTREHREKVSPTTSGILASTQPRDEESAAVPDPLPKVEAGNLSTWIRKDNPNDEASGYYYDTASGFYYDPSTKYFYDAVKRQFLYWSTAEQRLLVVSQKSDPSDVNEKCKSETQQPDQEDVAKKITKDMEKWAKTLHKKKDNNKFSVVSDDHASNAGPEKHQGGVAGVATGQSTTTYLESEILDASNIPSSASRQQGIQDGRMTNEISSDGTVDFAKLSCLTCKRRFLTKEILLKHIDFSELHKTNSKLKLNASSSYRDRAQERRSRFDFGK